LYNIFASIYASPSKESQLTLELYRNNSNKSDDITLPNNGIELGVTIWSVTPSTRYIVASKFNLPILKIISCFSAFGLMYLSLLYSFVPSSDKII
jgi:hypothetical protein